MIYRLLICAITFLMYGNAFAQPFIQSEMPRSIQEINEQFEAYYRNIPSGQHKYGYKQWQRWKYFWEQRADSAMLLPTPEMVFNIDFRNKKSLQSPSLANTGDWRPLGPSALPTRITSYAGGGLGRINAIAFHPTNSNTFWIGSAGGGAWRTTNGGNSWTCLTDTLGTKAIGDIAVNPSNPNEIFIGTGDAYALLSVASGGNGLGIFRSTDAGNTWQPTNFTFTTSQAHTVRRLLFHPQVHTTLFCAANNGIWRSTNGGTGWMRVLAGNMYGLEFHPTNPQIMYATSFVNNNTPAAIHVSTDGGTTWEQKFSEVGGQRIAIAVSLNSPNRVYAVVSRSSDSGFLGFYRSDNSGQTWQLRASTPNILGRSTDGSDQGGQGWWDLACAASPTNADEVFVGGINVWSSQNGGNTWRIVGRGDDISNYIHYDHHALRYQPRTNTLFSCHDGGVSRTRNSGMVWEDISSGLAINQVYRFDYSREFPEIIIAGSQDNGFNRTTAGRWEFVWGGDGMECMIDPTNWQRQYIANQNGALYRSENNGRTWIPCSPNGAGEGAWITPFLLNPQNPSTLYAAYRGVYKSVNRGQGWVPLNNAITNGVLTYLAVAPSDSLTMYAARNSTFFTSTNEGVSWENKTAALPLQGRTISSIVVHPTNPRRLFITYAQYRTDNIWESTDGGNSWRAVGDGLPAAPVNHLAVQLGTKTLYYAATDMGIYVYDESVKVWFPFSKGLPEGVVAFSLKINPTARTIRVGTMGRGVWESPLFTTPNLEASFNTSERNICQGTTVVFVNTSSNPLAGVRWNFPGGEPSTSTRDTVAVRYNQAGVFSVSIESQGPLGRVTKTENNWIAVRANPTPLIIAESGSPDLCPGDSVVVDAGVFERYQWSDGNTQRRRTIRTAGEFTVRVFDELGCQGVSPVFRVNMQENIEQPVLTLENGRLVISGIQSLDTISSFRWFRNGQLVQTTQVPELAFTEEGSYSVAITLGKCEVLSLPLTVVSVWEKPVVAVGLPVTVVVEKNSGTVRLLLQATGDIQQISVVVADITGRIIAELAPRDLLAQTSLSLELPALAAGGYIAQVKSANGKQVIVKFSSP